MITKSGRGKVKQRRKNQKRGKIMGFWLIFRAKCDMIIGQWTVDDGECCDLLETGSSLTYNNFYSVVTFPLIARQRGEGEFFVKKFVIRNAECGIKKTKAVLVFASRVFLRRGNPVIFCFYFVFNAFAGLLRRFTPRKDEPITPSFVFKIPNSAKRSFCFILRIPN